MLVIPLFAYDEALRFEMFVLGILPGCEHISTPHQQGVTEHIVVTEGEVEILIGETWYQLKENEGVKFAADQVHGYRNLSKKKATCHDIIHYPVNP